MRKRDYIIKKVNKCKNAEDISKIDLSPLGRMYKYYYLVPAYHEGMMVGVDVNSITSANGKPYSLFIHLNGHVDTTWEKLRFGVKNRLKFKK